MFTLKTKLKVGDMVTVIAGKEKGKSAKILKIDRKRSRLIVEGTNLVKRHQKGNEQLASRIIEKEAGLHISNVMMTAKNETKRSRVRYELDENKKKSRVLVQTGEKL